MVRLGALPVLSGHRNLKSWRTFALSVSMAGLLLSVPALASDSQPIGVNIDDPSPALNIFPKAGQAGMDWVRIWLWWRWLEPVQGQIDWTPIDQQVAAAEAAGLNIMATVVSVPSWANGVPANCDFFRDQTCSKFPASASASYESFLRRAVARYPGRVKAWGLWNEPNLKLFFDDTTSSGKDDINNYIGRILVPGHRAVKETDAAALVVAPDLAHVGSCLITCPREYWKTWLRDILRYNQAGMMDVVSHHIYKNDDADAMVDAIVNDVRPVLVSNYAANKPFWVTELGVDGSKTGLHNQAMEFRDVYLKMAAYPWWHKTFIYRMWDQFWFDGRFSVGLVAEMGSRGEAPHHKPSFYSVRNFADPALLMLPLDDSTSSVTAGEAPSENTGVTLEGGYHLNGARVGGRLSFASSGNFAPNQGTAEMWVRPDWSYSPGCTGRPHMLFYWGSQAWQNELRLFTWNECVLAARWVVNGEVKSVEVPADMMAAGNWYHIVTTWDAASGQAALYVNGQPVGQRMDWSAPSGTAANINIGHAYGTDNFGGVLDLVTIYGSARSAAQVAADYQMEA
ncbi:MAG: LamG-like jellyroll fold domain-containing protein [Halobacteria archaeon]